MMKIGEDDGKLLELFLCEYTLILCFICAMLCAMVDHSTA